ncbi:MAG TPA: hypothetical protein VJ371_21395 [Streptosporangiaceae bacterium]|nr:hypothetical protein [Streptosporangiaceae bacterium]
MRTAPARGAMAPVSQAATPVPVLVVSILLAAPCAAASFPWLTRAIGPGPRVNRPGPGQPAVMAPTAAMLSATLRRSLQSRPARRR